MWRDIQIVQYNILIEVLVRIILITTVFIMHVFIEPHLREITETELLHDYKRPRKSSLIPLSAMVQLIVCVPLIVFTVSSKITGNYKDLAQALLAWTLAIAINAFITESAKLIIGRPRPDYFYRCFPDGKITKDLHCTGKVEDILEGRKSFPSGHSSFSFCSLGFVSIWLCGKLQGLSRNWGEGLRVLSCLVPLVVAGLVAMTRYCDNHHHWEDVLGGAVIGFTTSYFCYRQYCNPLDSGQAGIFYDRDELMDDSREESGTNNLTDTSSCNQSFTSNKYD